ncbi:unnamed protein product [Paramecium primaurelia]|uniref:LITAF domain-containing protein n=1 Tax=Paramecium primaurelia TaxID=5886 RepID=A0A8S1Q474_PARPR|nr:unnamed protein product [Paramecium primaurelia]CAD8110439.1 unnamed protein product [Paramecium primaurelia]
MKYQVDNKSTELRTEQCQTTKQVLISHNGEIPLISQTDISYPKVPQNRESQKLQCVNCQKVSNSKLKYKNGKGAYLLILLFVVFIITIPLAILVYFLKMFKDVQHYCPECGCLIGTKHFLIG